MNRLYLISFIIFLIQLSPLTSGAALMVKETVKLEHVSTISLHNQHKRKVVYEKKRKRKRGFRKKWKSFWKKLKVKFKSIGKNRKQQKAAEDNRKVELFSQLSFFFVLTPLFVMLLNSYVFFMIAIWCYGLSLIFAIVGLIRIKKNPNRYKGKTLAIFALVFYVASFILAIIILSNTE